MVQEPKKYARVRELLIKDEEIKNARKVRSGLEGHWHSTAAVAELVQGMIVTGGYFSQHTF